MLPENFMDYPRVIQWGNITLFPIKNPGYPWGELELEHKEFRGPEAYGMEITIEDAEWHVHNHDRVCSGCVYCGIFAYFVREYLPEDWLMDYLEVAERRRDNAARAFSMGWFDIAFEWHRLAKEAERLAVNPPAIECGF